MRLPQGAFSASIPPVPTETALEGRAGDRPALVMVLAPVLGLGLWVTLAALLP